MTWSSERKQSLERENARIGFRSGDLLPSPAHPELATPEGYLALLRTIPDGAGVAGFIDALERHAKEHPLDGNSPHGWRTTRDALVVAVAIAIVILALGSAGRGSDEGAYWLAVWFGFPVSYVTQDAPVFTYIDRWRWFVATTMVANGLLVGVIGATLGRVFRWPSGLARLMIVPIWLAFLVSGVLWIRSL